MTTTANYEVLRTFNFQGEMLCSVRPPRGPKIVELNKSEAKPFVEKSFLKEVK